MGHLQHYTTRIRYSHRRRYRIPRLLVSFALLGLFLYALVALFLYALGAGSVTAETAGSATFNTWPLLA